MKRLLIFFTMLLAAIQIFAAPQKKSKSNRDIKVVKEYIKKRVGEQTLKEISSQEGGKKFLDAFFSDQEWMEEFAGSGPVWNEKPDSTWEWEGDLGAALKALELLVWNDRGDFITSSKVGRNIATSFALNHGHTVFVLNKGVEDISTLSESEKRGCVTNWDQEKLVTHMEAFREWYKDGTLDDNSLSHNTREWRQVTCMGQNTNLTIDDLRWIHNIANVSTGRAGHICHPHMAYRMWNCFGASVHGPMYYKPWEHCWNTQELRHRVGGVCGAISKFGSGHAASHGLRAFTAGQPGHCAFQIWDYDRKRWGLGNAVTGDTGSHFALAKRNDFGSSNEMELYYSNPKQMDAEYLRWQACISDKSEYLAKSMALVPSNWHAAMDWYSKIKSKPTADEYDKFAAVVRKTFTDSPSTAWDLYFKYLDSLGGNKTAMIAAAAKGLSAFKEPKADFCETYLFAKRVLTPLSTRFSATELWNIVPAMLDGQAGTPHYYNDIVSWASSELMKNPNDSTRFMKLVVQNSMKNKAPLDYAGMIQNAGDNRDVKSFKQVYKLIEKLPESLPKNAKLPKVTFAKKWPTENFGGTLLSPEGGLALKDVSHCSPLSFMYALTADDVDFGSTFHTGKDIEEWAEVFLYGPTKVTGVTIVNSPQNSSRQVPLAVEISDNGTDWQRVWTTKENKSQWDVPIRSSSIATKHVRIVRTDRKPEVTYEADKEKEFFHLKKILVYGIKQY